MGVCILTPLFFARSTACGLSERRHYGGRVSTGLFQRLAIDVDETTVIALGGVFRLVFLAGGTAHLAHGFRMRPCPFNLCGEVLRVPWREMQSGPTVFDNFGHHADPRSNYRYAASKCLDSNQAERFIISFGRPD